MQGQCGNGAEIYFRSSTPCIKGELTGDKATADELNEFFASVLEVGEAREILTLDPLFLGGENLAEELSEIKVAMQELWNKLLK